MYKRIFLTILGLLLYGVIIGISLFPSGWVILWVFSSFEKLNLSLFVLFSSISFGVSYVLFGISLLLCIIVVRLLFNISSTSKSSKIELRALYNFGLYHGLIAIAEKFFLPLIRGTFILNLFYRGLGMKIGKNTFINSIKISDCNLISIGSNCIIGGDVIINGHSAEGDYLHKGFVKIGNNVSIGSYSTILCGVTIEDNVIIGANSFIPKNYVVKKDTMYGGVPIKQIKNLESSNELTTNIEEQYIINQQKQKTAGCEKEVDLIRKDEKYFSILNSQYQRLHSEILTIENFISSIVTSSLGVLFTILMYGILDSKPKTILILPPLAILSAALILSTTSAMLRIAFKMTEIEVYFQKAGYALINWENKYGALGDSRIKELDGILIFIVYGLIIIGGFYFTISNEIVSSAEILFGGFKTKIVLIIINCTLGLWLGLSFFYLIIKTNYYKKIIKSVRDFD